MLVIDGSKGEGGGQVLRSSLALSLVTGQPIRLDNIRAGRQKPGLMRQHLTAVNAAMAIGAARVEGDQLGSRQLFFAPQGVRGGRYHFAVGTAGSCTLVLQTVLPALLTASEGSELILEGGTHNPYAPPFDFLVKAFLPLINRMGPRVTASLERPGFYPAGGGKFTVVVEPATGLSRIDLIRRGEIRQRRARALVARLPRQIGERELRVVRERLGWEEGALLVEEATSSSGPGNVLSLEIESEQVTEVFTGFGERGVSAERVASETVKAAQEYLAANVPVGRYLADQLLLPMALAGGGSFRTLSPSRHTSTNIDVMRQFLPVEVTMLKEDGNVWEVRLESPA